MGIIADLKIDATRIRRGGGGLWVVEYDSTKDPYNAHATLNQDEAAAATTLHCYTAAAADFGSSGTLDIDIFALSGAAETKAFSALSANNFTVTAITTARKKGSVVKKLSASDYTIADWKNLGELAQEGTSFQDKTPVDPVHNEVNEQVAAHTGARAIQMIPILLQTGKVEIDFLLTEARDKYYAVKYAVPIMNKGTQIFVIRMCRIVPDVDLKFGGAATRQINATIMVIKDGTNDPWKIYEG